MGDFFGKLTAQQKHETERQLEVYRNGVQDILPEAELKNKIAKSIFQNQPLKIKLGLDPSAPDVHIGHTVVLNKLKQFQDNGHIIQLIIGDFTDLHYNSAWLSDLQLEDVIRLSASITVARLLERNDFSERLSTGKPISLHEFFYPLMQGYDSVVLESDIELGGNDQHFNVLMGRHLQEHFQKEKQVVILMPLLEGLDGKEKMSKSKNNYIGVNEDPNNMYGKTMSIPDELIPKYFNLATDLPVKEKQQIAEGLENGTLHPRDAKMLLGKTIVRMYHGTGEADKAELHFKTIFQKGAMPDEIPEAEWKGEGEVLITDLLAGLGLLSSKTEARKMIAGGGIRLNGQKVGDVQMLVKITNGLVLQAGKRKFVKLRLSSAK